MSCDFAHPTPVRIGDEVTLELPFSEAFTHMRVAGTQIRARVLARGVQLYRDGHPFSAPIIHQQAGIFTDPNGSMFYYPPKIERRRPVQDRLTPAGDLRVTLPEQPGA